MRFPRLTLTIAAFATTLGCCAAQNLPGSMSFAVSGFFSNGVAESSNSHLITDK